MCLTIPLSISLPATCAVQVAATRQMLKEEEMGRLQALQIMQGIAQQLQQQRQDQGFSLTSVNLRLQQCGASMAPNGQLVRAVRLQIVLCHFKLSNLLTHSVDGGALSLDWPSTGHDCAGSAAQLLALLSSRSGHCAGHGLFGRALQVVAV